MNKFCVVEDGIMLNLIKRLSKTYYFLKHLTFEKALIAVIIANISAKLSKSLRAAWYLIDPIGEWAFFFKYVRDRDGS